MSHSPIHSPLGVIILAAGQGKRMKSSKPKILHEIGGFPLLFHVLERVKEVAPQAPVAIVVGHAREAVEAAVRGEARFAEMDLTFIHQMHQRGTGDAARSAMDSVWGEQRVKEKAAVLVLPGDLPLITRGLIEQMVAPLARTDAMRLLTCDLPDPRGYGRIVRKGKKGAVLRIVEEKDANIREKAIYEVGASIYFFQAAFLRAGLQRLSNKNAQGEYYLTDMIAQAARAKKNIDVYRCLNPDEVRGVNDLWELAQASQALNERILKSWALEGVLFDDPRTTRIGVEVELSAGVRIGAGAQLQGVTRLATGVVIGPHVVLRDVIVGAESMIKTGTVGERSTIGVRAQIGPYAHLRPDSEVGDSAKIGNFVELKKTRVGSHTSVAHLSYLGDAEVGNGVNIGCGFVTCNFDGRVIDGSRKHKTIIEDDAFIGSDCQTVAPVKIGKGAYVASGSTITDDVEAGALAIARSRQVTKPGYAQKLKKE